MSSISYQHLFCADLSAENPEDSRVDANVLYARLNRDILGVFFGYSGAGCFEYGYFWIDGHDQLRLFVDDWRELPGEFHQTLERLDEERQSFEDWSDEDEPGRPSARGVELLAARGEIDAERRVYWSPGFDRPIAARLSEEWPLLLRCRSAALSARSRQPGRSC